MDKKLYRSRKNRKVCGVCGGTARYFNVDPTLVRLIWGIAILFCGAGLLAYILAAIIIPDCPPEIDEDVIPSGFLKGLSKSQTDKKICGVCGGIAAYFGFDVSILRVVWACCIVLAGFGLWAYIIAAVIMD